MIPFYPELIIPAGTPTVLETVTGEVLEAKTCAWFNHESDYLHVSVVGEDKIRNYMLYRSAGFSFSIRLKQYFPTYVDLAPYYSSADNDSILSSPGDDLAEYLEESEETVNSLAKKLQVSVYTLSSIIDGNKGISTTLSKSLEEATGVESSYWINRNRLYEKDLKKDAGSKNQQKVVVCSENLGYVDFMLVRQHAVGIVVENENYGEIYLTYIKPDNYYIDNNYYTTGGREPLGRLVVYSLDPDYSIVHEAFKIL